MAKRRRIRWDRVLIVFGPLFLLIMIIAFGCHSRGEDEYTSAADSVPIYQMTTTAEPVSGTDVLPTEQVQQDIIICLDPGHGGGDGGAVTSDGKRSEKDDDLNLALATREAFRKYPHVQIIMTRETDVFVELQERCDIANNANADYFISIHRNTSTSGNGVEIWIPNSSSGNNTWDKLMAEYILDWLKKVGISDSRGIKSGYRDSTSNNESDNYYVNRYTNMPSCLIEMGFMNSKVDNRNFDDHLNEYAEAIADAVMELLTDKGVYNPEQPQ